MADHLSKEQRSRLMSNVKGKDNQYEMAIRSELHKRGFRFRKHLKKIPGSPDIIFTRAKVAVFIDGDFWHGYRFPQWKHKLKPFWREKISTNRNRDQNNFKKLREMGWKVIRIWQHDIENDSNSCVNRISESVIART